MAERALDYEVNQIRDNRILTDEQQSIAVGEQSGIQKGRIPEYIDPAIFTDNRQSLIEPRHTSIT